MSILTKLDKYISIYKSKCIVYQPGRVGSTGVTNSAKSIFGEDRVIHLHSAGLDRVYCMKSRPLYYKVNYILGFLLRLALNVKRLFKGQKTLILVPMRDEEKRNKSVFIEYFELLVAQARQEKWYRELYKGDTNVFIKRVYDELLEKDGFRLWVDIELKGLIGDVVREIPPSAPIVIETYSSRVCLFDVKDSSTVIKDELGIDWKEEVTTNTGRSKWCYDFIDSFDDIKK